MEVRIEEVVNGLLCNRVTVLEWLKIVNGAEER